MGSPTLLCTKMYFQSCFTTDSEAARHVTNPGAQELSEYGRRRKRPQGHGQQQCLASPGEVDQGGRLHVVSAVHRLGGQVSALATSSHLQRALERQPSLQRLIGESRQVLTHRYPKHKFSAADKSLTKPELSAGCAASAQLGGGAGALWIRHSRGITACLGFLCTPSTRPHLQISLSCCSANALSL